MFKNFNNIILLPSNYINKEGNLKYLLSLFGENNGK